MHKFPSIDQYRNAIRTVTERVRYGGRDEAGEPIYNHDPLPTLTFQGTVKLHGTNAAIVMEDGNIYFQSRERVLSLDVDNAGFMAAMQAVPAHALMYEVLGWYGMDERVNPTVCIYGEWCGQGIQRGAAISELPKRFVVFAVKIDDLWLPIGGLDFNIVHPLLYNIQDFRTWSLPIDFNHPELSQNVLIELTDGVERCCPVASHFGVDGVGEGIVWRCTSPGFTDVWFKVKGEKHSASQVKTLAAVDVERIAAVNNFVASVVTDNRLEQGIHVLQTEMLKPLEMTSMGDFIRWVFNDILKEEADTMEANGIDRKAIGGPVANACRSWFAARVNTLAEAA